MLQNQLELAIRSLQDGQTLILRAAGGQVQEIDVPPTNTARREILENQLRKGDYVFVEMSGLGGDDESGVLLAPANSATKSAWVKFAVAVGADRTEAETSTKDQLIEQYGD